MYVKGKVERALELKRSRTCNCTRNCNNCKAKQQAGRDKAPIGQPAVRYSGKAGGEPHYDR